MSSRRILEEHPEKKEIFLKWLPQFTQNEISPIFQRLDFDATNNITLFDVGANHGLWSAAFLNVAGHKTSSVELFEPLPGNIHVIKEHIVLGLYCEDIKKVVLNEYGISFNNENVVINFESETSGLASMGSRICHLPARNIDLAYSREVPVRTLDSVCIEKGTSEIDVLKIDIEGFELFALQGAQNLFDQRRVNICVFEFGPHQLVHRQIFKDFYDFFLDRGYSLYKYRQGGAALIPINDYIAAYEVFDRVNMYMAQRNP